MGRGEVKLSSKSKTPSSRETTNTNSGYGRPNWCLVIEFSLVFGALNLGFFPYSGLAEISNIRSIGNRALSMISFGNSTCGLRFSMQS